MSFVDRLRGLLFLGTNRVTLIGAILTTSSALTLLAFWAMEVTSSHPTHPYAGILLFLILPAVFVFGLVLMPIGILWRRRALRARGRAAHRLPPGRPGRAGVAKGVPALRRPQPRPTW